MRLKQVLNDKQTQLDINKLKYYLESDKIDIKIFSDIFTTGFDPDLNNQIQEKSDYAYDGVQSENDGDVKLVEDKDEQPQNALDEVVQEEIEENEQ